MWVEVNVKPKWFRATISVLAAMNNGAKNMQKNWANSIAIGSNE
jgi:hypothetical protein